MAQYWARPRNPANPFLLSYARDPRSIRHAPVTGEQSISQDPCTVITCPHMTASPTTPVRNRLHRHRVATAPRSAALTSPDPYRNLERLENAHKQIDKDGIERPDISL